jgi:broad specificity phosphatase PhoE
VPTKVRHIYLTLYKTLSIKSTIHLCIPLGKYKHEVAQLRKEQNLPSGEGGWDIWHDGCVDGETAEEMCARVDNVVKAVQDAHRSWWTSSSEARGGDVLIISHGHFSRCFLARWLNLPLADGQKFVLDPGGVSSAVFTRGRG